MSAFRPIMIAALAGLSLTACGKPDEPAKDAPATPGAAAAPSAAAASLPAPYNTADLDHGKALYAQCRSCHSLAADGKDMIGPNLHGVWGRKAGGKDGYKYSEAMKAATFTWDAEQMDGWLTSPKAHLPGTKMMYVGLADPKDRIDLIAYLKTETGFKP